MVDLKNCPTCGSDKIRKVRRTMMRGPAGRSYTVPQLAFHECPACGEQVYGPEAMGKIETYRGASLASKGTSAPNSK